MIEPEQGASDRGESDPYNNVRLDQWAARAYWTPSEIAALSLGKHPWSLNDEICKDNLDSWFTWEFWERRDVFRRAAETGLISWQCPPNKAVELLKHLGIPFVSGLEAAVVRLHPVVNWEDAFLGVLKWAKENQADHQRQLADHQAALEEAKRDRLDSDALRAKAVKFIVKLVTENKEVTARLEQMETGVTKAPSTDSFAANDNEDLRPPKLQKSHDMMIAGMAIYGYGFDPASKKSDIGTVISSDIAGIGQNLTPPVVAKHVRDACKRLGISKRPDAEE